MFPRPRSTRGQARHQIEVADETLTYPHRSD